MLELAWNVRPDLVQVGACAWCGARLAGAYTERDCFEGYAGLRHRNLPRGEGVCSYACARVIERVWSTERRLRG